MIPRVIGFAGRVGSGKSTAADVCVQKFEAQRMAFADPLKAIARDVFDFSTEQLYGELKEVTDPRYNFSPRWLFQRLGTEGIRRHLGEDIWANDLVRRVKATKADMVVIEDVRFANEFRAIKYDLGGWVIGIRRGDEYEPEALHASERLAFSPDRVIFNTESLVAFEANVVSSVQSLFEVCAGCLESSGHAPGCKYELGTVTTVDS